MNVIESINSLAETCRVKINSADLIETIEKTVSNGLKFGSTKIDLYDNKLIDDIASKSKSVFSETISSTALYAEILFDCLYMLDTIRANNITENALQSMSKIFFTDRNCEFENSTKNMKSLFVVSLLDLAKTFNPPEQMPEYLLKAYRFSKKGLSFALPVNVPNIKKEHKQFIDYALVELEYLFASAYGKAKKLNGFWGRALSFGKQKLSYDVCDTAYSMTLSARYRISKCKVFFGLTNCGTIKFYANNSYLNAFKTVISNFLELDNVFSSGKYTPPNRTVEVTVQGLMDRNVGAMLGSVAGLGMVDVHLTNKSLAQSQGYTAEIISDGNLLSFINGVLSMANSWNVDSFYSAKNEFRSWLIRLTK